MIGNERNTNLQRSSWQLVLRGPTKRKKPELKRPIAMAAHGLVRDYKYDDSNDPTIETTHSNDSFCAARDPLQ